MRRVRRQRVEAEQLGVQVDAFSFLGLLQGTTLAATVKVYPLPQGEERSADYTVQVEGQDTPVYLAKVAPSDPQARGKAMDDKKNSADFFEKASFTYSDFEGTVRIQITCQEAGELGASLDRRAAIPSVDLFGSLFGSEIYI